MTSDNRHEDEQWQDLVHRLGGTPEQAKAKPVTDPANDQPSGAMGPRDYSVAEEVVEDFQPPEPKPIAAGNPRTVLSWTGVLGSALLWIIAALLSWPLPWWLATATIIGFLAGGVSLFFLLPKTWAHRERFDGDDYGDGARL